MLFAGSSVTHTRATSFRILPFDEEIQNRTLPARGRRWSYGKIRCQVAAHADVDTKVARLVRAQIGGVAIGVTLVRPAGLLEALPPRGGPRSATAGRVAACLLDHQDTAKHLHADRRRHVGVQDDHEMSDRREA